MHLSAVFPGHPTQQRWWLVDRVDFRPLLLQDDETPHSIIHFRRRLVVVLLFNFDCFRIVSGDFTHTSMALRGSVFFHFFFFFLFRWQYASSSSRYLRRGLSPKKKTAAHHTLKWSASSNVHYSTLPLVRSRGELFHFHKTLQQLFTPGDLPLFWATRKSFLLPESHSRKCSTPIAHRVIRRTTSFL